jgi:hypothetical protein
LSQKSSALSILFEGGETLAIFDPTYILPKNHKLFCEGKEGLKMEQGKKEKSVTTSL